MRENNLKTNPTSIVDEVDVELKLRSHAQYSCPILTSMRPIIKI